jgi:hypothetical protein
MKYEVHFVGSKLLMFRTVVKYVELNNLSI